MVNIRKSDLAVTSASGDGDPPLLTDQERRLALAYAPAGRRAGLAALWALDVRLADIVRTTREPIVGQMRLTWWHQALCALDDGAVPAEPVLSAIARDVIPPGVNGAQLAAMIDGWEALLGGDPPDAAALHAHGQARGATLFDAAARVLGGDIDTRIGQAGQGWALVDLACHLRDRRVAERAVALAAPLLSDVMARPWPVPVRPIGMLAALALHDSGAARWATRRQGAPLRILRMLRHRIGGR